MSDPSAQMRGKRVPRGAMHNIRDLVLHGLYLTLYAPFKNLSLPFANYLRFAVLRLFGCRTRSTAVADGVTIWYPWRVQVGRHSTLNQGVIVDGFGTVSIGAGVRIAAYCCLNTADHAFEDPTLPIYKQGFVTAPIEIGDDVWLGAGVKVNKGVSIGAGSVIGAGAVVTRNMPPMVIAAGVPCRVIGHRSNLPTATP